MSIILESSLMTLQSFINESKIPKIKSQPKTFLGIAKQPHFENVLSNIYAFYFNVNESHKMQDLFLKSLLEIIRAKKYSETDSFEYFYDFQVFTENSTKKGGRIDLLLCSRTHAIIIENKVYHHLNNDLQDYWDSILVENNENCNKVGIVLSLNAIHTKHPLFLNITHLEFLTQVMQNFGQYLISASDKYVTFLKDLYQNILNMSKSQMDTKDLDFYYKNQQKIEEIKRFNFSVRTHIINEVEKACNVLGQDLKLVAPQQGSQNSKRLRYFTSLKNNNLMITVVFEGLMTLEQNLIIIVELKNDLLKDKLKFSLIEFNEQELRLIKNEFYSTPSNHTWAHFAVCHYKVNSGEVAQLGNYIVSKLENDGFLSIFNKIEKMINQ